MLLEKLGFPRKIQFQKVGRRILDCAGWCGMYAAHIPQKVIRRPHVSASDGLWCQCVALQAVFASCAATHSDPAKPLAFQLQPLPGCIKDLTQSTTVVCMLVQVESLSGGERRRLHLAAVLASTPNVLILDEPTNDLDLSTVEVLEEMLSSYRGLLLVVSHDRSFMEGATEDLLVLPGDGSVTRFQGTYSDYLQQQAPALARYSGRKRSHWALR